MNEDSNKPLYEDYLKQKGYRFLWTDPIVCGKKSYKLIRPLVVTGWLLIISAICLMCLLNPFWVTNRYVSAAIGLILILIATSFYKYKFVYRFGRFRVKELDETLYCDEAESLRDKNEELLKAEENRKAAWKSRRAFLALFAGIIAAVLLYCFVWIGLSYTRVPSWHRGEIEELRKVAQKYDRVRVGYFWGIVGITENGEGISQQDRQRLSEIFHSLRWEYVSNISVYTDSGRIEINIDTPFGHSKLFWHDDITDAWPAEDPSATVIQIDEHWVYVRMNDGRAF